MSGYTWVHPNAYTMPYNAVQAGHDADGAPIYVGRAYFHGDQLPCKIIPQRKVAYVSHNCREHRVHTFEVLCQQRLQWIHNSGGRIPPGAVPGGRTASGETLYVGKVRHGNSETVGKVHPSHACLYIAYGGQEISYRDYEILVYK